MTTFRVTREQATVTEISYDVEAATADEVYELESPEWDECEVHRAVTRQNTEIVGVEETTP